MGDWHSYDDIAPRYDELWSRRFETVARHLWALIPPLEQAQVLDIGTGTGIVPHSLGSRLQEISGATACDRSAAMLSKARVRMPALRLVAAEASRLPLRDAAFDVVTAGFLLSHLPDPGAGLAEAHRVLKPGGLFAMTSWAAHTDPYTDAWNHLLAEAVPSERLLEAVARVTPHEGYFGEAANVESTLNAAGFSGVEVHTLASQWSFSPALFVSDREIGSSGRFARHALGPDAWSRFVVHAREDLRRRFGTRFHYRRGFLIGLGRRL